MTVQAFLAAVAAIAAEGPTYRLGGTGADGTCDCIGLVMGAMHRADPGIRFALHSSNYFARFLTDGLSPTETVQPVPGMIVYKARRNNGTLNDRYQNGGSYDNGDPLDYYHAGVVTSTRPVRITHCTSGGGVNGITTDNSLKGWSHAGYVTGINYAKEEENMSEARPATVVTQDGNPLKLRPTPSTEKPPIAKMPASSAVQVLADAAGWAKVVWQGQTGYCMSRFLQYGTDASGEGASDWQLLLLGRLDTIIGLLGGDAGG